MAGDVATGKLAHSWIDHGPDPESQKQRVDARGRPIDAKGKPARPEKANL